MEKLGKKMKHNHLLTNLLKFGIFSIVMLAPIFSVATRCLYVICNKNAKDSYNGAIAYQQNIAVEKPSDLLQGKTYDITIINNGASQSNNASYRIGFSSFTLKEYLLNNGITNIQSATYFTIGGAVGYTNNSCFAWYDSNMNYLDRTQLPINDAIVNNLKFVFTELNTSSPAYYNDTFKDLIKVSNNVIVYQDTLDNVFEYSLSQLEQSNYYNWATNLGIYTPIHNMTSGLGAHDIVALLIAYWSIYIAIYIVFDIVIVCFTKISHLIKGE